MLDSPSYSNELFWEVQIWYKMYGKSEVIIFGNE